VTQRHRSDGLVGAAVNPLVDGIGDEDQTDPGRAQVGGHGLEVLPPALAYGGIVAPGAGPVLDDLPPATPGEDHGRPGIHKSRPLYLETAWIKIVLQLVVETAVMHANAHEPVKPRSSEEAVQADQQA